jgi:hypothetical protein
LALSTKTVHELHKSNIRGKATTSKPLTTENNAQMHDDGVMATKPGHYTTGNA